MFPYFQALSSMTNDMLGRGSVRSIAVNRKISMLSSFLKIAMLPLIARFSARGKFMAMGIVNVACATALAFGTKETLTEQRRRPFVWRETSNPASAFLFFNQTKTTRALAVLLLARAIPLQNETGHVLRHHRFKERWTAKETSRMELLFQMSMLADPVLQPYILQSLGLLNTARLSSCIDAFQDFNRSFATRPSMLFLNPIIGAFRNGMTVQDRIIDCATLEFESGEGQLSVARNNLRLPVNLFGPVAFSEMFAIMPELPSYVCVVLNLVNAMFVIPWAVGQIDAEILDRVPLT
jgi:hypothetical protein